MVINITLHPIKELIIHSKRRTVTCSGVLKFTHLSKSPITQKNPAWLQEERPTEKSVAVPTGKQHSKKLDSILQHWSICFKSTSRTYAFVSSIVKTQIWTSRSGSGSDRLPQLHLINRLHELEICWMGPQEGEFPPGDTTIQFQGMKRVTLLVKNEQSRLLRENWVAAQLPKTGADENPRDPLKSLWLLPHLTKSTKAQQPRKGRFSTFRHQTSPAMYKPVIHVYL